MFLVGKAFVSKRACILLLTSSTCRREPEGQTVSVQNLQPCGANPMIHHRTSYDLVLCPSAFV